MSSDNAPCEGEGAKQAEFVNRRAWVRYRCSRPISRRMAIAESYQSLDASVADISVAGVGLWLGRRLEGGTLLFVELESAAPDSHPVELLARVIHVTPTIGGGWLVGCEFANRLSDAELRAVLG